MIDNMTTEGTTVPSTEIDNTLKIAQSRYSEAKNFFLRYNRDRFQRYLRNYRNDGQKRLKEKIRKYGDESWMSNIVYPLTSSYIDSVLPIVSENVPQLGVKPANSQAKRFVDQVNNYFINYWTSKSQFNERMDDVTLTGALYGIAFPAIRWATVYKMIWDYNNGDVNDVVGKIEKSEFEEFNDPLLENLDVFSTYPYPYAKNAYNIPYFVSRHVMTKEEGMQRYSYLFEMQEMFGGVTGTMQDTFKKISEHGDITDYSDIRYDILLKNPERNTSTTAQYAGNGTTTAYSGTNPTQLYEFVEVSTVNDVTIYCGNVLIGKIKNLTGENLIGVLNYRKPEYGIWGIGIAEDLDIAHYYINTYINQEADIATIDNFPMYAYDPNTGDAQMDSNMDIGPSKMIAIAPDQIKSLDRGGSMGLSYKIIDFLKLSAREGVGIDETTRGSQLQASMVATQVNAIRESTNRRVNQYIKNIGSYESQMMKLILKLGFQLYKTKEQLIENKDTGVSEKKEIFDFEVPLDGIDDTEFLTVEKEAFNPKGYYRYVPSMSKQIEFSRQVLLQDRLTFLQELNKLVANPTVAKQLENLNVEPVLKDIFDKFGIPYTKPKGMASVSTIQAVDALANIESPDMASQLPDSSMMSTSQQLSTINQ